MNTIQFFIDKNCLEACDLIDVRERPVEVKRFELQMFPVDIGNGKDTWCGTLQRLHVGEKHYFKGWSGLVANLQRLLTPNAQLEVLKAIVALIRTVHPCENRDVGGVNTATLSSIINTVSTLES